MKKIDIPEDIFEKLSDKDVTWIKPEHCLDEWQKDLWTSGFLHGLTWVIKTMAQTPLKDKDK